MSNTQLFLLVPALWKQVTVWATLETSVYLCYLRFLGKACFSCLMDLPFSHSLMSLWTLAVS